MKNFTELQLIGKKPSDIILMTVSPTIEFYVKRGRVKIIMGKANGNHEAAKPLYEQSDKLEKYTLAKGYISLMFISNENAGAEVHYRTNIAPR